MDPSAAPWRALDASQLALPPGEQVGAPGNMPLFASTGFPGAWLAFAALAVSGVFAVGAFAFAASGGGTVSVHDGPATGSSPAAGLGPGRSPGTVVIEISGAVVRPGVHELPAGTRVGEAIDAAGGYGPRVDAARTGRELNLAAVLTDGDQIHVPSRDDPSGEATGGTLDGAGGSSAGRPIDLNRATQPELESLPGIGPVTAQKIIAAREDRPFASVDELRTRELVGEKTFENLRDLVAVR